MAAIASHPIQYQTPLFRYLANLPGIDLHVFFCNHRGDRAYRDPGFSTTIQWDVPLLEGYRHTFLPNRSPLSKSSSFGSVFNPTITPILQKEKFDALWIHGWALATNWLAWVSVPKETSLLLRAEATDLRSPSFGPKDAVRKMLLGAFFRRIDAFLSIGTRSAVFYRQFGVPERRIFLSPYAVDNAFFTRQADSLASARAALRQKEGIPETQPLVLFAGKLIPRKRPLDLLKACLLLKDHCSVSVAFVGEGVQKLDLQRFVRERRIPHVYFLGFRNQSAMASCYAMADLFVLPSQEEPWGLVLNEAMCFKLPLLASDRVAAATDLIRVGENGFIFPAGDIPMLTQHLAILLKDASLRLKMGQRSLDMIRRWGIREAGQGIVDALRFCRTHAR